MKKFFLITSFIVITAMIFFSCAKNAATPVSDNEAVERLVNSEKFIRFSTAFIPDFVSLMNYHKSISQQNLQTSFINDLRNAGNDENKLATAYQQVSLNYPAALLLKNKLDNDLLTMLNQHPFLQKTDESRVKELMMKAIETGLASVDPEWKEAKQAINAQLKVITSNSKVNNSIVLSPKIRTMFMADPGLTIDEVWDCLKNAVGFGTAGILGIGGLQKLAQEGIQAAVISVSKWLAERAGWIGLGITVIDFGVCVYKRSLD